MVIVTTHSLDTPRAYQVFMVKLSVNSCLLTHPTDAEEHEHPARFWPLVEEEEVQYSLAFFGLVWFGLVTTNC